MVNCPSIKERPEESYVPLTLHLMSEKVIITFSLAIWPLYIEDGHIHFTDETMKAPEEVSYQHWKE